MRFTLHYRGKLKSNGDKKDKHNLRVHFHKQLKNLWETNIILSGFLNKYRSGEEYWQQMPKVIKDIIYFPLFSEPLKINAHLDISILTPELPGKIVTDGGDLDNRLKTLFDSLTIPKENQIIPEFKHDDEFFFCLLEDDKLISSFSVRKEQLLTPITPEEKTEVDLRIEVSIRISEGTMSNIGLLG